MSAYLTSIGAAILGFIVILLWRIREGQTPVTAKKILIPPLGMATGFSMFVVPLFRIPWLWALIAFLVGAVLLAWPLVRTSRLHRVDGQIMMHRSKAFFIVIVVLALIRLLAKNYVGRYITLEQTAGLFFVLAFGMIVRWRGQMYHQYRRLTAASEPLGLA
jgi:membrane protein CcdC involved in cytochrome C biogenesis